MDGTPEASQAQGFHELMPYRVQRILLVASPYDSFIMSQEGHLQESLMGHFLDLELARTPDLVQVASEDEAVERVRSGEDFDLVIATINSRVANPARLAQRLHETTPEGAGSEVPVMALAYSSRDQREFEEANDTSELERIFRWQGDARIFLAMVLLLEDRLNVENDTGRFGVPAIILVEDDVRFYSSFLPAIYDELHLHMRQVLAEDLNLIQKTMRMRARPKLLLFATYENAWKCFERYEDNILGVISDFEFPREGKPDPRAGETLCRRVLERRPDVRIVMQSSEESNRARALAIGPSFLLKGSPTMLQDLRKVLVRRFGFGDFLFRRPDGTVADRASDLNSLREKIAAAPDETLAYHAERNHFSNWLKARTEFAMAATLRPRKLSEFEDIEDLRVLLLDSIDESVARRHRTVIADFDRKRYDPMVRVARIGGGSLGGKARGIAFMNRVLQTSGLDQRYPNVEVYVPFCVVLGTEVFDEFLEWEAVRDFAVEPRSDEEIMRIFMDAPFPRKAADDLRVFLKRVRCPLAVRSSSLLEDSLSQPFAGVYKTYMVPNNEVNVDARLRQLTDAVKRVWASSFLQQAKTYLSMTAFRLEEERMAVIVQELAGRHHGDRFYPDFSGVARSLNYYPEPGHKSEDGVAALALGLGHAVVGGEPCLRFCPSYPRQAMSFASVGQVVENSQREFFALDLMREVPRRGLLGVLPHPLEVAEEDGVLAYAGSTWDPENNVIVDGIARPGTRLVSFSHVLKYGRHPLPEILVTLLEHSSAGIGGPVEIEFAGSLGMADSEASFAFLQLRPLVVAAEAEVVEIGEVDDAELLCRSETVLGNGLMDQARDLVVVDVARYERSESVDVVQQIARFDSILRKEGRPYLLIGVGRWGSADPHLGIGVAWNQITGARAIVEAGFRDLRVEPSQGTHFFQNLSVSGVGYLTVNPDVGDGHLDWPWLSDQQALEESGPVRLLRFNSPLVVKMEGHKGRGVILKPQS